jgi:membrane protease subunit HflK
MAWNEPGGSGGKDPWGSGGGRDQGPPDLDEVVKKIQAKFSGIFGGGGGGRGAGGGGSADKLILLGIIVAFVAWALSGIYIVEEGKQGVILQFGKYKDTTMPGLHWFPRFIESKEIVDVSRIRNIEVGYRSAGARAQSRTSVERESLMLTQDENIVDVELAVQYRVKSARDYLFNVRDPDTTLHQATESAVRELIGKSKMDFVLTEGRGEIGERAEQKIQQILDLYQTGLIVTSVNMQNAQPPDQVQHAFADAVKAREDEERLKNKAEAYSNDILPKARGAAARVLEEANAYKAQVVANAEGEAARFEKILTEYEKAPAVTRERLYLEAVESVLSKSSKIMLDVENGNNLLYLPLDRLVPQQTEKKSPEQTSQANPQESVEDATRRLGRQVDDIRQRLRSRQEAR